ncbi:MAG: PspC domain-containing protein [Cytophagales bacterium]|nr:MAG: PspC domain-containing protein [Cytophagales bacterium]
MKKVFTITLFENVFQIEEDAYLIFQSYFLNHPSKEIEQKIVNILLVNNKKNQVITQIDANFCISNINNPIFENVSISDKNPILNQPRHFFRDINARMIGGVCAGMAAYLGFGIWIIRLGFLLALLLGSLGFWIYIILWIAVPKPKNEAERLSMQGKKKSFNEIILAFESQLIDLKEGKYSSIFKPILSFFTFIISLIIRLGKKISGVLILFISFFLSLFLLLSLGIQTSGNFSFNGQIFDFKNLLSIIIQDISFLKTLFYSLLIFVAIPLFYFICFGLWLLKSTFKLDKILSLTLISIWVLSLSFCLYYYYSIKNEFSFSKSDSKNITLGSKNDFVLKIAPFVSDSIIGNQNVNINIQNIGLILADSGLFVNNVSLKIQKSKSNLIDLIYTAKSNGNSIKNAQENLKNMSYNFSKIDNNLYLDDFYKLLPKKLWRNQKIELILLIPEGQYFYLDSFLQQLKIDLSDVKNDLEKDDLKYFGKVLRIEKGKLIINEIEKTI